MKFPDPRMNRDEERILPLINVVFLLLIFFMVAGSLTVTEPFEVTPPFSASAQPSETDTLMILMGMNNQLALDNKPIEKSSLLKHLQKTVKNRPQTSITLKADNLLPANQMVRFTQELYEAGVKKIHLLTQTEGA